MIDTFKEVLEWFGDSENFVVDIVGLVIVFVGMYVFGNVVCWLFVVIAVSRLLEFFGVGVLVYSF